MNLNRMLTITRKEFIHIMRDRPSMVISFLMPIMMLLLFGFAVNTEVSNVNLLVYDGDKSMESRELTSRFSNSYYFKYYGSADSPSAVETAIEKGDVKVGLIIPEGYTKNIKHGRTAEIQVMLDGSDPTIARTAASYAAIVTNQYGSEVKAKFVQSRSQGGPSTTPGGGIVSKPMVLYNPTLESSKFNIPGVVGLILQNITIILTALAMVREKELGTMEQLIMTPVTPLELIVGKLIPYILIGCYDFAVILTLSWLIFGVTVQGSMLQLVCLGLVFLIGSLAMGMLISTIAKNQAQAIQGSLALLLPSVLLSGFMFPREAMPPFIYWLGAVFPITHFLVILRGIILKGISVTYMLSSLGALLLIIVILIAATAKKFSKTMD